MKTDWHDMIQRYIAGLLNKEETTALQHALKGDPSIRTQFLDYMNLDAALEVQATTNEATRELLMAPACSLPNRRLLWRPLALAAVFLTFIVLTWLLWPGSRETRLVLASADVAVNVERDGATLMLPVGTMLRAGDVIVSESAGIVVSYPEEETRLELAPMTRLEVLSHREGKKLRLLAGSLGAEVAPQPEARPMRLYTSEVEAVVLGTRFTLSAEANAQELAVQKGAVRVNRSAKADSIVVSAEEKVKLGAKSLELEPLPPVMPLRWRDANTLALDFETDVTWPVLRRGRVGADPAGAGRCLAGELTEMVRRQGEQLVLTTSLRPQCVLTDASRLKFRYWTPPGIESIELSLYVFGVERAFKVLVKPAERDRWVEWSGAFAELKSAAGAPPASGSKVRSLSVYTNPVNGPMAFYVDDVVLENVSAPPPLSR